MQSFSYRDGFPSVEEGESESSQPQARETRQKL